jgi:hypothetical protein
MTHLNDFRGYGMDLMKSHIKVMKDLVNRDKNRASVLMWSIGNEPKSTEAKAPEYFQYETYSTGDMFYVIATKS